MPRLTGRTIAEHRHEMLGRVFTALGDLMYERGYDAITLADIARAAGMSRTAIYNYYPDKESLLVAYTEHEMDEFFSTLRAELHRVDDPVDRLVAFVRLVLIYFATHHLPPGSALRGVVSTPGYARIQQHAGTVELILTTILDDAAAEGRLGPGVVVDAQTVALITACLSPGRVRELHGAELDAAVDATVEFVLRAVGVTTPRS